MILSLLLLVSQLAHGASLAEGRACLSRNDVACAREAVESLGADTSGRPELLRFAAETAFYGSDYERALALMERAVEAGFDDRWDDLALYRRTVEATRDWTVAERGNFHIAYRPGVDAVLIDSAAEALRGSERHIAPLLGGPPGGPTRLEVFPDGRSFIDASSLTKQDVQTTGVVALSKWSRLLLTSPRALGRGYGWQDTVAHEYIHLVVSWHTDDRAPVWMQEAIAKYLDGRWRDGSDRFRLSVRQQGLLAEAIRTGEFVSYQEMHPSLAKLPSADLASLAYAQLATLMAFAFERAGDDVLLETLPLVRDGVDPFEALARGVGMSSFAELEDAWRDYVRTLDLLDRDVASMPTVLDGGDAVEADPILSDREDLARWVRLGDLLRKKERYRAALVEYAKAEPPDEPRSPLLSNRIAQSHLGLDDVASALDALRESLVDYPEFPLTHKTLGQIQQQRGQLRAAAESYRRAIELNPFDRVVQESLVSLYEQLGETELASRHARYVQILKRGGEG